MCMNEIMSRVKVDLGGLVGAIGQTGSAKSSLAAWKLAQVAIIELLQADRWQLKDMHTLWNLVSGR